MCLAKTSYAPPLVGVAHCYVMMGIHGLKPATEAYPLARAAANAALEIDPDLATAMTALADISKGFDRDWKLGEGQFLRAIELDPEYAFAHRWYANLLSKAMPKSSRMNFGLFCMGWQRSTWIGL